MVAIITLVATSGERLRVKTGVFAVYKLCDPHLSASAVSFLLWGAIQCMSLPFFIIQYIKHANISQQRCL